MSNWPFLHNGTAIHVTRSEGVHFYTKDGRKILDGAGGAIVCNIGHGREEVADAIHKSTVKTGYVLPPWNSDERNELVDQLSEHWMPSAFTRMHFTSGGSEAIETAMKIAIQHYAAKGQSEKMKIIGRDISYHGTTLATTAVAGHETRKVGIRHALQHYPAAPTPYPLRCEHENPTEFYLNQFEETLHEEDPETVAAFVAEPIVGASGGAIVPPDGYWEGIREICERHDILLILDEVMTGFGRTGTRFGFQHWPIEPDIFVGGKGLTGGYAPLNGVFSTDEVAHPIEQTAGYLVMFHTYGPFPPACAAATKVLALLDEEDLVNRAKRMGRVLTDRLNASFSNHPHVAEVRGKGLLQAIEIVKNRSTLERYPVSDHVTSKVVAHAFREGVHFYGGGTTVARDIVVIGPPLIVEETHIDTMVEALSTAVDRVTQTLH